MIFVSPLLSFSGPPVGRVRAQWTHNLAPIGERNVLSGQRVELYAVIDASAHALTEASRIWFEVVEQDFLLTRAPGDRVVRLVGSGVGGADGEGASEERTTVLQRLAPGDSIRAHVERFVREQGAAFAAHLLVVEEEADPRHVFHVVTWWTPTRLANRVNPKTLFVIHVDDALEAQSDGLLSVAATTVSTGSIQLRFQYEDESPMADAEFEAIFPDQRVVGRTDAQGLAILNVPTGPDSVFRVVLQSYPSRYVIDEEPVPPEPRPGSRVVAFFAFDRSFPRPVVFQHLKAAHAAAQQAPTTRLMVIGHTDPSGSDAYNQKLSERRAEAVLALLTHDRAMFDEVAEAEGWDLAIYQAMLRALGCNPGPIDGEKGPLTRAAVRGFQIEYNVNVYHQGATPRSHPDLGIDGDLGNKTMDALRDSYMAMGPRLPPERLTNPPAAGCGELNPITDRNEASRRAVVAFFPDVRAPESLCGPAYAGIVGERGEPTGPWFSDFQWLRAEDGTVHLSALTAVPDGRDARFTIYRCEGPVLMPPPESSGGRPRPDVGPEIARVTGKIRAGVCFAQWTPPAGFDPFDVGQWLVSHDAKLEIESMEDHAEPAAGSIDSASGLLAAAGMHPLLFAIDIDTGGQWGFSGPPGQRLNRVRFVNDPEEGTGVALRTDGSIVDFHASAGRVDADDAIEVVSLTVATKDVEHVPEDSAIV